MGVERSFLDQLLALLQQVKAGNGGALQAELAAAPDDDEITNAVYAALAERERELKSAGEWIADFSHNTEARMRRWSWQNNDGSASRSVYRAAQRLSAINQRSLADNIRSIAAQYALSSSRLETTVEQSIATACVQSLNSDSPAPPPVGRYALEVGAASQSNTPALTPLGEQLLLLRGRDLIRMLLANEVVRSTGDLDHWRINAAHANHLLNAGTEQFGSGRDEDEHPYRFSTQTLHRMSELSICKYVLDASYDYYHGETYTLTPEGAEALADTVARGPTPFTLRARALLNDSNARLVPEAAMRVTSSAQLVEHAQMVAHELGNKLSAVNQRIELLRTKVTISGVGDTVNADLDRVQKIVANIQTFADEQARIAGAADAAAAVFEPAAALREIAARLKAEFNGALELQLPETLPLIRGMKEQLGLVVEELVRNARRANPSKAARIILRAAVRESGGVEMHVEDNGPGVAEDRREAIFDPGVSDRTGGGQGLAQVRRTVALHFGGVIECARSTLGGADFRLVVPADKQETR